MQILYKDLYETPLECIERYRETKSIKKTIPMTYAGRLDPMAEGVLICLVGDECKHKDKYTALSKEYEFEILVGYDTDSYDLLGLVKKTDLDKNLVEKDITTSLMSFKRKFQQSYPPFSSKPINGTPRFVQAKKGIIEDKKHTVELMNLSFLGERTISSNDLLFKLNEATQNVKGDFRQKAIFDSWTAHVLLNREYKIFKYKSVVSSGFYIRQLVKDIGKKLATPMTTFWIKRTKVGNMNLQ